jgi:predicted DNA repair protein MutK
MASAGLLALLDDIATVLDDVAVMAKIATKKTMAIAGDDLAVGAEAMVGLDPKRELPIVWAVAKGSLWNKAWLVPLALVLTLVAPWILTPLLMLGGAFLCYEGVHKGLEKLGVGHHEAHASHGPPMTAAELEKTRVRGAIRTDVILSAEIVVIALNAMADATFGVKALTLSVVAVGLTFAIYGLIALIVKADDVGLHLIEKGGSAKTFGRGILFVMPPLMKLIGIVGTLAMFLVGGGIMAHGIPGLEDGLHHVVADLAGEGTPASILSQVGVLLVGVLTGFVVIGLVKLLGPPLKPVFAKLAAAVKRKKTG